MDNRNEWRVHARVREKERERERYLGKSVLAARHDDDDDICMHKLD